MSEANSLPEQCYSLIDKIVENTLKGKISSKGQVYRMLVQGIPSGAGEIFERCLAQRIETTTAQLEVKLKATRMLRALQTIEGEWSKWQQENQATEVIGIATKKIISAPPQEHFLTLLEALDPNQTEVLNREQLVKLSQSLQSATELSDKELGKGISDGLKTFGALEGDLISWIYEQGKGSLGFGEQKSGPWGFWAKKLDSPLPKQLFQTLAQGESVEELARVTSNVELRAWVELVVLLQYLQRGLVAWFDRQPYDAKMGKKLSYSTFLTFAAIWVQLSRGFDARQEELRAASFQVMLQILRGFARRDDFPLYGGIFVSFSGEYLQDSLEYFSEPLQQAEGTEEKARLLTLLGYSQRTLGQYQRAKNFHEDALEIATEAEDQTTVIANFNHLSRLEVQQKEYDQAISYSQRALIFARQGGDRLGEANALVNLGYAQVFGARQNETMDTQVYETAISYLQQGLELAKKLEDRQSQALAYNSLGIAHVILSQPASAITALEKGTQVAVFSGDVYLQGLNFSYLGEAYYSLENRGKAVYNACLGMYLLEQIKAIEWRQSAGLLTILQGQMGTEAFQILLDQYRPGMLPWIGVDGFDHLLALLEEYKQG